jgi:DNA-binding GntR family transcriptional regulator
LIDDLFGLSIVEADQEIAAVSTGPDLATVLMLEAGTPALEIHRRYTTSGPQVAQVTINTRPGSRFILR